MSYILGLDLGTNSIGWACIDENNQKILGMGSRIFPEGVDRDTKGKEVSKNTQRRNARQLRRQLARRSQRKENLKKALLPLGMFPQNPSDLVDYFQLDSYELRKKGLDHKLSKIELGRVLYHLNQRRGFKSSRKAEKDKEDGVVAQQTLQLQKEIEDNNCRTLGEFFATLNPSEQRIRDRYTLRKMYEQEFDLLWESQKSYHPELTDDLKEQIRNRTIFYQRPLKSQAKLIGFCSLEPKKRRCAKERLVAQKFRILETVNRLSFADEDGVVHEFFRSRDEEFDPQIDTWRNLLIQELWIKEKLTFKQIKKLLGVPETVQFNLEKGGASYLKGNTTGHALASIFGKGWHSKNSLEQERDHQIIRGADDPEWLKNYAINNWNLAEDKANKLSHKISFQPGYLHYSTKALSRLTPYLEQGLNLTDAKLAAGYTGEIESDNPKDLIRDLRNPIVQQTLYELVRLLEVIRNTFGEPEKIRVELARKLKASAKKREEIHFENLKRKNEHDEIRDKLRELGIAPNRNAIILYKLWKECGETCPYTGDPIPQSAIFSASPSFQVEHIIPFSRSLDDSYMNKTLCRVDENRKKGNQSPYECYHGTQQFDEMLQRLKKNISENGMPYNKLRKFMKKEVGEDFISRQLNDTAYISRHSKKLMEALGFKVSISKGQATAELRHLWGLNSLISPGGKKNREDHRHHAIDAAVVAMTDSGILHKLSSYNKYNRSTTEKGFPLPWTHFRETLKPYVDGMLISFRVNKRARGALHEESLYGITGHKDEKGAPIYVIRKPLNQLTPAMIDKIVDPTVKGIIKDHLRKHDVDPDKKKFTIPKEAFKETVYMKSKNGLKIPIKKVRIQEPKNNAIELSDRNKTAVEPGGNHHVILYRYKDNKGLEKQSGEICTTFEAVRRKKNGEPIIRRDLGPDKQFLLSLSINEMALLNTKEDQIDWNELDYSQISKNLYRVQKISNQITLRHHRVAVLRNDNGEEIGVTRPTHSSFQGIKVRVDRIGRICKAHD